MDRLLAKKAVFREKKHGVWVFQPAVERETCLLQESRSFLDRFFHGDPAPLFAHLVQNDALSDDDVDRLRRMLDSKLKEKGETDNER